jgi:hypothetical protein
MTTAFGIARVGSVVGAIGAPHDVDVPIDKVIFNNIGLRDGVSPVRRYIPELMPDIIEGRIKLAKSSTGRPTSTALTTPTRRWTTAGDQVATPHRRALSVQMNDDLGARVREVLARTDIMALPRSIRVGAGRAPCSSTTTKGSNCSLNPCCRRDTCRTS